MAMATRNVRLAAGPTTLGGAARLLRKTTPMRHKASAAAAAASGSSDSDLPSFPFARPSTDVPPAEYAEFRKKCPIGRAKLFDGTPIWLITKLHDTRRVLEDNRFSKVRTHPGFPELVPGAKGAIEGREPTFVDMDPPEHTKFRGTVQHAFTPQRAEEMRAGIQAKVDELVDAMQKGPKPVDLAEVFSMPVAFKVIYELLGIPFSDYKFLSSNVAVRASGSSNARDAAAAQQDLTRYMEGLVAQKEKSPGNDLISDLVVNQLRPGHITKDQLVATAFLLLVAGNATVASMINLGVVTLLQHPDQLAKLKANMEGLMPGAVEEILRYHTASSYALRRVAKEDVELGSKVIRSGEGIIALNQSANRDEEHFPDPDRFDITRSPNPHIAFGYGTHVCIAEFLARVEMQCAFKGLFTRLPGLKLAVPEGELKYSDPRKDVGLLALPVTW